MLPTCIWLPLSGIRRVCDNKSHFEKWEIHISIKWEPLSLLYLIITTLFLSATSFAHVLHFKSFVERRWQNYDIVYVRRPLHRNDSYPSIVCVMIMFILMFLSLCLLCLNQSVWLFCAFIFINACQRKNILLLVITITKRNRSFLCFHTIKLWYTH